MKLQVIVLLMFISITCSSQGKYFGGNGDGFAVASVSNIVLPLRVIDFSVWENGNAVKGNLIIVSDEHLCNVYFERSYNGIDFTVADTRVIINPWMQDLFFSFTDRQALAGKCYYRARIVKCDGNNINTAIVFLNSKKNLNKVYYSILDRTLNYAVKEKGSLKIINSTGQLLWMRDVNPGAGTLPVTFLTQGIYLLQFADEPAVKFIVHQ